MPASDTLDGYLLKKEACERYDRSLRQLGRDFDKAQVRGDSEFTANFRLRLEDGTVLEADETSKDQIQEFRDKGLNPTWFVKEAWMVEKYGHRGDQQQPIQQPDTPPVDPTPAATEPALPPTAVPSGVVMAKDELINVLREENRFLRESLNTEREQNSESLNRERERSKDDRELTKQLHILLKNMQDRLLPEPDRSRGEITITEEPTTSVIHIDEEETVHVPPESIVESDSDVPQTPPTADEKTSTRRTPKPSSTKKRKAAKRGSTKKQSSEPAEKQRPAKWYGVPTLKRFLSR